MRARATGKTTVVMLAGILILLSGVRSQDTSPPQGAGAPPSPKAAPASPDPAPAQDLGTLVLVLKGNRQFCVTMNELGFSEEARKPRQKRNSPLITTMGYKYQISVSRRGSSAVNKLMESPTIRTVYYEAPKPSNETPQPRLPTARDKKTASQPFGGAKKIPRWIPDGACTTLQPEYSFPLAEGRYDVYLGFDLLTPNGRWVPLQSDFVVDLSVEKGRESRVEGTVDYSGGERTVVLSAPGKKASSGGR